MASLYKKPVVVTDPKTGKKIKSKSKKWWGRYRDEHGVDKRVPLATEKAAAQAMLAELERKAERRSAGIEDPFEKHRKRPLSDHIADFKAHLLAKGNTAKHARITNYRIGTVLNGCKFTRITNISASRVQEHLAGERANGVSIASSNHYLRALKMFTRWLVRDRRTPDDVLAHMSMLNGEMDIRRERRTLEQTDIAKLISAAKAGKAFRGLTGDDRAMLYLVALNTGLRTNELASLTISSFNLEIASPTVTVEAAYSKHRRRDVLPLRADLAAEMRDYILARRRSFSPGRLWPKSWHRASAQMLQIDLKAAGIPYTDEEGRVFDFHSLRHQFISNLARSGVHPKEAQVLARHSTITLTMDRYTHVGIFDLANALERLPVLPSANTSTREAASARATGTDGRPTNPPVRGANSGAKMLEKGANIGAIRFAAETQQPASICTKRALPSATQYAENPEENAPVCAERVESAAEKKRGAARIRTGASRICNPLP